MTRGLRILTVHGQFPGVPGTEGGHGIRGGKDWRGSCLQASGDGFLVAPPSVGPA